MKQNDDDLALRGQSGGSPSEVIARLRRAVALNPRAANLHHNLGEALEADGQDAEAVREYRFAILLDPKSTVTHFALARLLLAHGHFGPAIEGFKRALEFDSNRAEIHVCLAQALIAVDRDDEATHVLRRSIEIDPSRNDAYAMLGYRLQTRGSFHEARANFARSIDLQPLQSVSYYGLTQSARFTDDDRGFLAQMLEVSCDRRLSQNDRMILLYSIGKARADLKEFGEAMAAYDQANELARKICLGGRRFPAEKYALSLEQTRQTYSRATFDSNRASGSSSERPIFIVGMMRSGTTLVDQILSSHPEVGALGERDFWLRQDPRVPDRPALAKIQTTYLRMLDQAAPGKAHVTDKTPQNFQMLGLIHSAFPKAKIVHVRRNPVDNCLSIYTNPYEMSPAFAHDRENIVFAYVEYRRLMDHWRKVLPEDAFFEADYEELVADHETTVRRMVDFCGLPWREECLSHERNERAVKTPSLWQVRQPIYTTSIERWRDYEPWLGAFANLL